MSTAVPIVVGGSFTAFSRVLKERASAKRTRAPRNEQGRALSATAAIAISNGPVVRRETEDVVARLILNRSASRNSLSEELLTELIAALASLGRDTSVRAIIRPFGAHRGRMEPNAFENALFLWEAAQQHAASADAQIGRG